ncbi:DUF262 domain-containing protein [Aliarcobacter cryaerophilus]|uniref:DUF262 domain-containing HNH endonuclease family protein n=1 Tax=Aliarcobacter cryaerophilus TaxID=28198 RepID=A0AA46N6B3_9BACT|nr:DUF262 domain-containing protein [Aliarcobacter cryaerophilus]UYF43443.1 DUF262 domain-containing HNH endonuclease family protein [Aliarcobacter cryaerophilus]
MKTEQFSANLITLRTLFINEYEQKDRAKTFYIPLYQRDYNWPLKNILKLFEDIYGLYEDNIGFQPYFLGGFVFSRESMEGPSRTSMSLEIIDGQQRLMTLSLMIACLVQCLKFEKRNYISKKDYIDNLINELTNYLITKRFDNDFKVSTVLKIERTDKLKDIYEIIIKNLIEEKIVYTKYKELKKLSEENKTFINNIQNLNKKFKNLNDDELLHFSIQLLDHTQVVITKTDSFETGYLVFEKLNDSGKLLDADDLLKNFLFRVTTMEENLLLKEKWNFFIENINDIEPKISPKLFLEYYLISKGIEYGSTSTSDIFKSYRNYFSSNDSKELELLDKMNEALIFFKELKSSDYCNKTINQIDFKLGYIICLSFYAKFGKDFSQYEEILKYIFRFGYVYLLTEKIKPIKKIITNICIEISKKNESEAFDYLIKYLDELIVSEKEEFTNQFINKDRYRKEQFTKVLFEMINVQEGKGYFDNENLSIEKIMPQNIENIDYEFEGIDKKDNEIISKYANLIGNLVIYNSEMEISTSNFNERVTNLSNIDNIVINNLLNNDISISDIQLNKLKFDKNMQWGKKIILERSELFKNYAIKIFIEGQLSQ